ncbi:MAG: flagellar biosynthesis protein FlgC [Candidatus Tectomicrobia bacterium]|uniref:Flagellar biosynthesis protein FlgC n=1 Tax=Tectimicrobiota bacterium TaxID=2528274 RepID=A0A932M004_UNCTE|nr:flagellar biosynthesis protein FlgC [Candidatus Tectomicrobia bacterium]
MKISGFYSALSAISAFGKKFNVSANNVANLNTNDFKRSRVTMAEQRPGGVKAEVEKDNTPGAPVPEFLGEKGTELSNVELQDEVVDQIIAQRGIEANLKTVKTADQITKSVIDILA